MDAGYGEAIPVIAMSAARITSFNHNCTALATLIPHNNTFNKTYQNLRYLLKLDHHDFR